MVITNKKKKKQMNGINKELFWLIQQLMLDADKLLC